MWEGLLGQQELENFDPVVIVQGIGLLHWASDRGLVDMVTMLLDSGADINLQVSGVDEGARCVLTCQRMYVCVCVCVCVHVFLCVCLCGHVFLCVCV